MRPMNTRRSFLLTLTMGLVALAVLVAPVIAEEFFGAITKVDVEGKKMTVATKNGDIDVTVNDDTEVVTKKGTFKATPEALEKISDQVKKQQEAGKKGAFAKFDTDDKKVARKIQLGGFAKKKDAN